MKKALAFITFITFGFCSFGATFEWAEDDDDEWGNPLNWTITSGTDADGLPDADDDVIILEGEEVVLVDGAYSIASLTLEDEAVLEIDDDGNLTVNGNISINELSELINRTILVVNGDIDFNMTEDNEIRNRTSSSDLTISGNFINISTTTSIRLDRGTTTFNGNLAQDIPNSDFDDLIFSGTGKKTIYSDLEIGGDFIPGSAEVEYNSNDTQQILDGDYVDLTFSGAGEKQIGGTVSTSGTFSATGINVTYNGDSQDVLIGAYGILQLNGSGTHTISGDLSATSFSNSISSVEFNSSSTQTIPTGSYNNLIFSGIGQKNISGITSVTNTLTSGTGTTINVTGSFTANTFEEGTATYNFSANADQVIPTLPFYNLAVSGSGDKTITGDISINDLTTSESAIFVAASNTITVGGIFTNDGTFDISESGTLDLAGSEFTGSSPITLSRLYASSNGTLTLNNQITLSNTGVLTITNGTTTMNANGNLLLDADFAGFARVAAIPTGSSITGDVTSKAYIDASSRSWWHLSNAVATPTVSQWTDDIIITGGFVGNGDDQINGSDYSSMYFYNEDDPSPGVNDGWQTYPDSTSGNAATDAMLVGRGYRVFIRDDLSTASPKTLDVTGTLNQGDISIPLTYDNNGDPDSDGWNFVGNPYPSSIDWSSIDVSGLTDANAFVWDAEDAQYKTLTTIAPYQAFFIQNAPGTSSLNLTESNKIAGGRLARQGVTNNRIHVSVEENQDQASGFAETDIYINANATSEFDRDYEKSFLSRNLFNEIDANNLMEVASRISTGKRLTENHIPESEEIQEIPLYVAYSNLDNYIIQINLENYEYGENITLVDYYTDTEVILDDNISYDVKLTDEASRSSDRFTLLVGAEPVGLENDIHETGLVLFPNPVQDESFNLTVLSAYSDVNVSIIDMSGNVVYTETINNSASSLSTAISTKDLEAGVYFVNVISNGDTHSEKLVVNK